MPAKNKYGKPRPSKTKKKKNPRIGASSTGKGMLNRAAKALTGRKAKIKKVLKKK